MAELKAGDDCKLVDQTDGILVEQEGGLVCVPKQFENSAAEAKEAEGGVDAAGDRGAETGTGNEGDAETEKAADAGAGAGTDSDGAATGSDTAAADGQEAAE